MSDASAAPPDEAAPTPEPPSMHGCPLTDSCGQAVLHPTREQYLGVVRALLDEGYEMCVDLTAVDYLLMPERALPDGVAAERFEVVVNLLSLTARQRIRLRVQVPADDPVDRLAVRPASRHRGDGARGVRHVRHHVHQPSRPHPHPDARGLGRPPAAQGLRPWRDPGAVHRRLRGPGHEHRRHDPRPATSPSRASSRAASSPPASCCARSARCCA